MLKGAHGLKGAVALFSFTRPENAIASYRQWWLSASETPNVSLMASYEVRRCWQHGNGILAELENVADRSAAEALGKAYVFVAADAVEVDEDEYLWDDLVGCEVWAGEQLLGTVSGLQEYGAQDILCIENKDGEWMLPFIDDVVVVVDIDARRIEVNLLPGMESCFTPNS